MLKVIKISKKFGENKVLNNCSFFLKKQEIVVLVGENGSGKSTLFKIILGLIKPDKGQVLLNGADINGKAVYNITNKGAYSSLQSSTLFENITVLDHLLMMQDNSDTEFFKNLFFLKNHKKDRIKKAEKILKKLEIKNIKNSPIAEISFGQRKLVNLGMSLLSPQPVLLLDEIFAGVNGRLIDRARNILINIKEKEKKSIVLISHDIKFAHSIGDRVVYMRNGSIVE